MKTKINQIAAELNCLGVARWACAITAGVVLWTGPARAVTTYVNTSVTMDSPDPLPAWGPGNILYLGNSASNLAITLTNGTLTGGAGLPVRGTALFIGGGSNNVITVDGPTARLIDTCTENYSKAAFRMQGTGTKLIVQNGGYFEEDGYAIISAASGEIRVTGVGSVAVFDPYANDGVEDRSHTTKINVLNGGAFYAGSASNAYGANGGFANYRGTSASDFAINVDGLRSVVGTNGFSWYDSSSTGILKATNGGALELLGNTQWTAYDTGKAVFANIRIDGGVLSYKDATGVDMNKNQGTNSNPDVMDFTWAGNNAFRLNNSGATDPGSYTLANNLGSKNYTRLEMINGTTAVARAITIDGDHGGSLLFDGTVAAITNGVTLSGAAATLTATGAASTLTGVVGGGALVKTGAGKLTLNTAPTYGGDTTISEGTLALAQANANNEASTVAIASGAMLELAATVTDTVGNLSLDGAPVASGTWGSSASAAANQDDAHFAGSGVLNVGSGGSSPYQIWAGGADFTVDVNGDGVANGLAWMLTAGSVSANACPLLPAPGKDAGYLTLHFLRVHDLGPAKLYLEYSNDLNQLDPWHVVNLAGPLGDIVVDVSAGHGTDEVTVKIPVAHASVSGRLFGRLRATEN